MKRCDTKSPGVTLSRVGTLHMLVLRLAAGLALTMTAVLGTLPFSTQAGAAMGGAATATSCGVLNANTTTGVSKLRHCTSGTTGGSGTFGNILNTPATVTWKNGTTTTFSFQYTGEIMPKHCKAGEYESGLTGTVTGGTTAISGTVSALICVNNATHTRVLVHATSFTFTPNPGNIQPGGVWTLAIGGGFCEVQTFSFGNTFTADDYGDAGTYSGGGKTISEDFTAGEDSGSTFSGMYSRSSKGYSGTGEFEEMYFQVTLTKGAEVGC
jgi:hypothetical protein